MGTTISEEKISPVNKLKVTALSLLGLLLAGVAVAVAVLNPIVMVAKKNTRIAPGSPVMELLKKLHGVNVETYLFNVTNAERFLAGRDKKLKVQEVGPFTYVEHRVNEDMQLDMKEGVLRYTPRTHVEFLPEKSIADPKDVNVTMPNIALLAMASMLSSKSSMIKYPFSVLASNLKEEAIVKKDAFSYMWGYEEALIKFGNKMVPGQVNFTKLGILDRLYDPSLTFRLEVGVHDDDKFRIKRINGLEGMEPLGYNDPAKRTKCNSFIDAYEGIGYPPGVTPDTKIRVWRNVMCRILETDYAGKRTLDYGPEALVFKLSNRTYNYNPDKQCLCEKGACYNGLSDLSPCFMGLPLAISNAHFLDGEPRLFRKVEGLHPDEETHGSEFLIEPTLGAVLGTRFTVQMNVVMNDVRYNGEVEKFSDMVVPIAYFKIVQSELPEATKTKLRFICYSGPKIQLAVEIITFLVGISILGYCLQLYFCTRYCGDPRGMAFSVPSDEKEVKTPAVEVPLMITRES